MGLFRLCSLVPLLCAVAAVSTADTKPAAKPAVDPGEVAKRFVATLIEKSSAAIGKPQGCLSSKPGPATVGRELSMIFGNYIDSEWDFSIAASCEKGESPARQSCRVEFNHKDDESEASVGFMFKGNPADGSLDARTLECFQTP
jgi:hypothetical protein